MGVWAATSGTWFNLATVLLGSLVGSWLGPRLRSGLTRQWRQWLGLTTLVLGAEMVQPLWNQRLGPFPAVLPALLALVLGVSLGEGLGLDRRLRHWLGRSVPGQALGQDPASVVSGAFVLFCVGPMTLLGCLRNGALGDPGLLLVKSSLDGVSAAMLAAGVGLVLAWVLLPLALVQFSLSGLGWWLAGGLADPSSSPPLVFTAAVGGLLVLGLALELLELPHPSITNGLVAVVLAPALGWAVR